MKTLAEIKTYSTHDCTSIGYKIEVRDNGTMRLTHRSCWQGTRTGDVYIVQTPPSITAALAGGEDEPDVETVLGEWIQGEDRNDWRKIRSGYVVR